MAATLTPEIAKDLMWRSMTTGAPTSEFDKYGGYQKVADMYNANGGQYSREVIDPAFLQEAANTIANTGVGDLQVLKETNTPLTNAGYQAMKNNGVSWTADDLKAMNIPYEGFLKVPTNNPVTNTTQQVTPKVMGPLPTGSLGSGGYNTWRAGAAGDAMLGAGNADYHSELLKSLRQSSINPISNNQGVQFMQNRGSSGSNWTPPTTEGNSAFNPQVLNPRAATPQEVADWNAYSTYRTNALNSRTPIVSFTEWLASGKSDGITTDPDPGWGGYSGGGGA